MTFSISCLYAIKKTNIFINILALSSYTQTFPFVLQSPVFFPKRNYVISFLTFPNSTFMVLGKLGVRLFLFRSVSEFCAAIFRTSRF